MEARPDCAVIVLAAGASSRMRRDLAGAGGADGVLRAAVSHAGLGENCDKLLLSFAGTAQLRRVVNAARSSLAGQVIAVVRGPDDPRRGALGKEDGTFAILTNSHHLSGMGASIACGAAKAQEAGAAFVLITPADMPAIETRHFNALIARAQRHGADVPLILRAVAKSGRPGHPVLFSSHFFEALKRLRGDEGAKSILAGSARHVKAVRMDSDAPIIDLDTPEDLVAWLGAKGRNGERALR